MCQFFKKMRCCRRDALHDFCSNGGLHVFPSPSAWIDLGAPQQRMAFGQRTILEEVKHAKSLLHGNIPIGKLLENTSTS